MTPRRLLAVRNGQPQPQMRTEQLREPRVDYGEQHGSCRHQHPICNATTDPDNARVHKALKRVCHIRMDLNTVAPCSMCCASTDSAGGGGAVHSLHLIGDSMHNSVATHSSKMNNKLHWTSSKSSSDKGNQDTVLATEPSQRGGTTATRKLQGCCLLHEGATANTITVW